MNSNRRKLRNGLFFPALCVPWLLAGFPLRAEEAAKLPPDMQALVDLSHSAPPEFAADALLRIVESGRIENRDAKRDLVEQAFRLAPHAQEPIRRVSIPGSQVDTRSGYRGAAMKLGLNALSLECRAIRDMLPLNRERARELFSSIAKPRLEPLSCDDPLVYDVDDFYQTLQQIVSSAFTPAERQKDEDVHFLTTYLSGITAHAELAPAARAIVSLNLTPAQFEVAEGTLLAKFETVGHDDRSFSVAADGLQDAVSGLALSAAHEGLGTEGIVRAFRKYLVANLSGARCEDNVGVTTHASQAVKAVDWFNKQFHGDTAPIQRDEMQPSSVDGSAKIEPYWQSGEAKQILKDAKALRFSPQDRPLSASERNTPEWKQALGEVLAEVESWQPTAEASASDYFHQKAIVYEALLELAPGGDDRNKILAAYAAFLAGSEAQQESPVEWFWHAQDTLERLRNTGGGDPAQLLAAYKNSGNVVLSLFAALDAKAPAKPFYAK